MKQQRCSDGSISKRFQGEARYVGILVDTDKILSEYHRLSDVLYASPISPQSTAYRKLTKRMARLQSIMARMQSNWSRGHDPDALYSRHE